MSTQHRFRKLRVDCGQLALRNRKFRIHPSPAVSLRQKVLGALYFGFRSHRLFRSGNSLTQLGQRAVPAARRVARIPQHAGRRRTQSETAVGGP